MKIILISLLLSFNAPNKGQCTNPFAEKNLKESTIALRFLAEKPMSTVKRDFQNSTLLGG